MVSVTDIAGTLTNYATGVDYSIDDDNSLLVLNGDREAEQTRDVAVFAAGQWRSVSLVQSS